MNLYWKSWRTSSGRRKTIPRLFVETTELKVAYFNRFLSILDMLVDNSIAVYLAMLHFIYIVIFIQRNIGLHPC